MPELRVPPSGKPFYYRGGRPKFTILPNGCWEFVGALDRGGYGMVGLRGNPTGEQYAHRAAWVCINGPIPEGMTLDHLCRNRSCINPAHLEPVTMKVNVRRSPRTKLTEAKVAEIRSSRRSAPDLARKFNVTYQAIGRVRRRQIWN